jgi:hypothetical protein
LLSSGRDGEYVRDATNSSRICQLLFESRGPSGQVQVRKQIVVLVLSVEAFCFVARNSRLTTCCATSIVRYARAFADMHLAVTTIRWREKRAIAPMANHCPNAVPILFARMTSACANRGTVARPLKVQRAASTLTNVPLRPSTIVPPIRYAQTRPVRSIAHAPMGTLVIPPRPRVVSISTNAP